MITIHNLDKILAINSQDIEIIIADQRPDYYEFTFEHDNIHSTFFSVLMNRRPDSSGDDSFTMRLWDGISNTPLEYYFERKDVKDPFALLKYLKDVLHDWDIITNK